MILSDVDIISRMRAGDLIVAPIEDYRMQIQPCSIDLRLADRFARYIEGGCSHHEAIDPLSFDADNAIYTVESDHWVLEPGAFLLGSTIEHVTVPDDLLGRLDGRSTYGRYGVTCHVTAGFIDPGFKGTITLEIANLGPRPVIITAGERICQISFQQLLTPAGVPYGHSSRPSKYQYQEGPTAPKPTLSEFVELADD